MSSITVKQMASYFTKLAKITPDAPVYVSSDEEGNSYSSIEAPSDKAFSSFSVLITKDKKNIRSVIIYPWAYVDEKETGLWDSYEPKEDEIN